MDVPCPPAGRGAPRAPAGWTSGVYETMVAKRAMHGQAYGWEQPKWFVPDDRPLEDAYGWRRPGWFDAVGAECNAVRERVGVLDMTAFTKFEVSGPDARDYLDYPDDRHRAEDARQDRTQLRADRTGTDRDGSHHHPAVGRRVLRRVGPDGARARSRLVPPTHGPPRRRDFDVTITDRTTELGTIAIAGPNARAAARRR